LAPADRRVARPLPWLYSYATESTRRRGRDVLRPVVPVSIAGSTTAMEPSWGLVDTGAENVLVAEWVADLAGIDRSASDETVRIGIGAQIVDVAVAGVELRLHAPHDGPECIGWRTDVGFVPGWRAPFSIVLGQFGFLDQFTVTFHRGVAAMVVEDWDAFDSRFGARLAPE
jgi:hypothetical protein